MRAEAAFKGFVQGKRSMEIDDISSCQNQTLTQVVCVKRSPFFSLKMKKEQVEKLLGNEVSPPGTLGKNQHFMAGFFAQPSKAQGTIGASSSVPSASSSTSSCSSCPEGP